MSDPVVVQTQTQSKPNIMQNASHVKEAIVSKPKAETPAPTEAKPESKIESPAISSSDILKRQALKTEKIDQVGAPVAEPTESLVSLDDIKDPVARAITEKKIKDLESGYNKKYQTVAQLRKEAEDLKFKYSNWTPQRLAEELRKPEFVQAMQALQQTAPPNSFEGSVEEWSALSDTEKARMKQMEQEQRSLQSQLAQMKQKEEDIEIKKIYPDFEPEVVDQAIRGLSDGTITASRADIWKVVNHDKNVEKGYQFGYEDGYKKALEKLNGSTSLEGNLNVTQADQIPDEVRKGGFSSIAMWRLARSRNGAKKN